MSINLDLDKRDLAIEQIRKRIKEMDNEIYNVYEKIKINNNDNEILNEYETLFKDEENIKKKQIKKLKELYNYINKNNKSIKKNTYEDKNDILNEINKIENLLLRK